MLRPVLLGLAGLATASCGMVEGDARRFESMARSVASIPLDDAPTVPREPARPVMVDAASVANPGTLRVEVMDPHALWDARDAGLRGALAEAGPSLMAATAPATRAVMQTVADTRAAVQPPSKAEVAVRPVVTGPRETLQLGAFASSAAARAAWSRMSASDEAVAALTPAFESVEVEGRTLTRLKVTAASDAARAVCRAADTADLGCLRRG